MIRPNTAALIILMVVWLCAPPVATAQAVRTFDLGKVIGAERLKSLGEIEVTSAAVSRTAPWMLGSVGTAQASFVVVTAQASESSLSVEHSLRVSYNAVLLRPAVYSVCDARGACSNVEPDLSSAGATMLVDGLSVTVKFVDMPCKGVTACELVLPSWSLESRRKAKGASWVGVPSLLTVVGHKEGIILLDASSGREWLSLDVKVGESPVDSFGAMGSATLQEDGSLVLAFASGLLFVDFVADRIWAWSEEGLFLASTGVGQETVSTWTREGVQGIAKGRPLCMNQEWLVASGGANRWTSGRRDLTKLTHNVVTAPVEFARCAGAERAVDVLGLSEGVVQLWRLPDGGDAFVLQDSVEGTFVDKVRVSGTRLIQVGAETADTLTPDEYVETKLKGSIVELRLVRATPK